MFYSSTSLSSAFSSLTQQSSRALRPVVYGGMLQRLGLTAAPEIDLSALHASESRPAAVAPHYRHRFTLNS